ncbi:sterile alpha motif domain-containing protein 1-like [Eubalaena glacialis]|uniref:sterile alpha motif domain-containing protein 1-like n=1 Tax=Eubalaena glacialis TaxID=27606 RepID=UPI002A5A259E|nr:sterile alpha motif domain-containing protein 1-like [Eubalaena glacialis]XP_061044327.1 sterile alpha motif domain-containing protein 1-like [Eubalaena glacialis]XP_061044328.1 sterile alpha motif domain-containing protein 1-like [Eubalaena glacialis]XP_061044330.1 sterile alpha motif domain-containing protein 1-like [Eubalaena glacialis]
MDPALQQCLKVIRSKETFWDFISFMSIQRRPGRTACSSACNWGSRRSSASSSASRPAQHSQPSPSPPPQGSPPARPSGPGREPGRPAGSLGPAHRGEGRAGEKPRRAGGAPRSEAGLRMRPHSAVSGREDLPPPPPPPPPPPLVHLPPARDAAASFPPALALMSCKLLSIHWLVLMVLTTARGLWEMREFPRCARFWLACTPCLPLVLPWLRVQPP